ncbi:MAG: ComF family protein [Clostridia bacterium]|nr:ComF family protein [Clostridia bacterium]
MRAREFFERFILTRKCPACGELISYENRKEAFCSECRARWDVLKTRECNICGRAMCECICMTKTLSDSGALCHHKLVAYTRDSVVHNTVSFIKRNENERISGFLAEQMYLVLRADKDLPPLDADSFVITFVPRGRRAVLKYGVDQSRELALALSRISNIPFAETTNRLRGGKEQKKLTAAQRRKNVQKLFVPCEDIDASVGGKTVILIDDVVTTGASMSAAVHHLIRARAGAVICLSVASTPDNK